MWPRNKSSIKWILIGTLLLLAIGLLLALFLKPEKTSGNIPQFIQADFIDLDRIATISKFRSNSGHDFSQGTGETCRSMKHYFNIAYSDESGRAWAANNGVPPAPDGKNDIKIYSPVDGKIVTIQKEQSVGEQIYIRPDSSPEYTIRLFHVYKQEGIKKGKKVKAGEQIGVIGRYQNTDIAIQTGGGFKSNFISYFQAMPDSIFANYIARGAKSREQFMITKEYRDAHPLECNGEQFDGNYDNHQTEENFVFLSSE